MLATLILAGSACARSTLVVGSPPAPDAGQGVDAGTPGLGLDAGPPPDGCVELPPGASGALAITFVTRIQTADVFLLVDVTSTMGPVIGSIQERLRAEILPELERTIPDLRVGVGHYADFPVPDYGILGTDQVFRRLSPVTSDLDALQRALDGLARQSGGDNAEAMTEALYQVATGEGLGMFVPPASCPDGGDGYPCYRPVGVRLALVFTDAGTHNGPEGIRAYEEGRIVPPPHTFDEAVEALNRSGVKVLGLYAQAATGPGLFDLQDYATATGAITPGGSPLAFRIGRNGEDLTTGVVDAIETLANDVVFDLDLVLAAPLGGAFDPLDVVAGVATDGAAPPDSAIDRGSRFEDVRPATTVRFLVQLRNDVVVPGDEPQVAPLLVRVRADGASILQEQRFDIVVPAADGRGC